MLLHSTSTQLHSHGPLQLPRLFLLGKISSFGSIWPEREDSTFLTGQKLILISRANTLGFKLFFSFDMTGFSNPDQFTSFLQGYVTNGAYYKFNGLPLVSTFNGGASNYNFGQDTVNDGWKVELQQVMANAGLPIYFVPAFQDVAITSSFFTTFPTLNG